MREYITQWVRLCESICAPDKVVWCETPPVLDETQAWKTSEGIFVTPLSEHRVSKDPAFFLSRLTELPLPTAELKGVLQDRTMYIAPYLLSGGKAGIVVTDSPGTIARFRREGAVNEAVWETLFTASHIVAQLELAFPSYHLAYVLERMTPVEKRLAAIEGYLPPDLKPGLAITEDSGPFEEERSPFAAAYCHFKDTGFNRSEGISLFRRGTNTTLTGRLVL